MISSNKFIHFFIRPLWAVLLYLFMAITTLHLQVPFFLNIHIEVLTLIAALILCILQIYQDKTETFSNRNPLIIAATLGSLFIITPIITSLAVQDQLSVLYDDEYRTLLKMIIFTPCLFLVIKDKQNRNILLNGLILFYTIFALYFLYRYLILHEVREFDQRPLLKIRHGDANFLCTFFSMVIPLSLMQAWSAYKNGKMVITAMFMISTAILFISAILTQSRMGLIAIIIGLLYLLTRPIFKASKKLLASGVLSIIVLFAINSEHLIKRFSEIQDKSNSDRYLTWKNGFNVFSDYPIFGAGIHKAKLYFYQNTTYPHFQEEMKPLEVHNTFLKALAELGLSGFILFSILFFWPWSKTLKLRSSDKYFLISSMTILTLSIMTIGVLYKDLFILHLFFIAALATDYSETRSA